MEAIYKEIGNFKEGIKVEFDKVFTKIEDGLNKLPFDKMKEVIEKYTDNEMYELDIFSSCSSSSKFTENGEVYELAFLEAGSDGDEMVDNLLLGMYNKEEYSGKLEDGENKYQLCVFSGDPRADYFFEELKTAYNYIQIGSIEKVLKNLYELENSLTKK